MFNVWRSTLNKDLNNNPVVKFEKIYFEDAPDISLKNLHEKKSPDH